MNKIENKIHSSKQEEKQNAVVPRWMQKVEDSVYVYFLNSEPAQGIQ